MIEPTLTMIPGPTPVRESILDALARPTVSHVAPQFVQCYRDCLDDLKRSVFAERARPFIVSGSGTLAMEMALLNVVATNERLLIVSQGYFGDRWEELARAFGIPCDTLRAEWGRAVEPDALRRQLDEGRYAAVAMTHVDTSTGTAAALQAYCDVLRGRDELAIVDGVCATAGMEQRFDAWGIDLLVTGAQKALGAPPGVAIVLASERAMDKRRSLKSIAAYSADLLRWAPIMDDPALYFSTPPVNEIVALREALRLVVEEGPARFRRHAALARAFRAGVRALGLDLFTDERCLADTLSVVRHAPEIDDAAFRGHMAGRGVIVAGALGPIAGKAFRVGHMGNIGSAEICRTLQAAESAMIEHGRPVSVGCALAAAAPHF